MVFGMSANLDPTKVDKSGDTMTGNLIFSTNKGIDGGLRFKVGTFTRDMTVVSGNQAISGIGFKPSAIIFFAAYNGQIGASWGIDDGTSHLGLADTSNATINTHSSGVDTIYYFGLAGITYRGQVLTFDADGFTIAWIKTGATAGTLNIIFFALR